jgi:hypothetical protein
MQHTIRMTDSEGAESGTLLEHARQMNAEGRQILQQFGSAPGASARGADGATGRPAGAADRQGGQASGAVQTLARQAHEIIRAIDDLGQEARAEHQPARQGREERPRPE